MKKALKTFLSTVDVIHDMAPVFIIALPILDVHRFPALFDYLELQKKSLAIVSYHLEQTSMDDVFFLVLFLHY